MKTLPIVSQGFTVLSILAVNGVALLTALNITEQAKEIDDCHFGQQQKAHCFQDVVRSLLKDSHWESTSFSDPTFELLDVENKVSTTLSSQSSLRLKILMQDLLKLAGSIRHFRMAVTWYLKFLESSTVEAGIQRRADIERTCEAAESNPELGLNEMFGSITQFIGRKESRANEGHVPYTTTWAKQEVILLPKLLAFADYVSEALLENAVVCWALNKKQKEYVEQVGAHLWNLKSIIVDRLEVSSKELDEDIKSEIKLFTDLMQELFTA